VPEENSWIFHNIPYFSLTATACQSPEIGKRAADKGIIVIVTSILSIMN
jgi:hypothetical protein